MDIVNLTTFSYPEYKRCTNIANFTRKLKFTDT